MSGDTRVLSDEDHRELLRLEVEALGGRMLGGYALPPPVGVTPKSHKGRGPDGQPYLIAGPGLAQWDYTPRHAA